MILVLKGDGMGRQGYCGSEADVDADADFGGDQS
jgi:hypothetical protein